MAPPTVHESPLQSTGLALAHWDDDGAPAIELDTVETESRFCLAPVSGQGDVDGAWWPRTRDVQAELTALLTAVLPVAGRTRSVALHRDAWSSWPMRLQVTGHRVSLGWFTHIDTTAITISGSSHDPLRLRLIPFDTPPRIAAAAMTWASSDKSQHPKPSPQPTGEWVDHGPGWQRRLRAV
jgi:hypothetical protein